MNHKEHKKISRQRKRLDRVCSDLQFGGGILIVLGLFSDMIRAICFMQFQPGIGSDQWIIIGFGVLMVFLGWRGRR